MNIIQKYKTYKALKNYLDKHYEYVELVAECPKIDVCRIENNYCFDNNPVRNACIAYAIKREKTDGVNVSSCVHRNGYKRPMDDVKFRVNIVNTNGTLQNVPKFVIFTDKTMARHINDLFAAAYRHKLIAEQAKIHHK